MGLDVDGKLLAVPGFLKMGEGFKHFVAEACGFQLLQHLGDLLSFRNHLHEGCVVLLNVKRKGAKMRTVS